MGSSHASFCSRQALLVAALAAVAALLAGCFGGGGNESTTSTASTAATPGAGIGAAAGGKKSATAGVYVGQVQGTNDLIGLVTDGSRLTGAYLCIPQSTSQWIRPAPLQSGQAALVARRGVVLGSAKFAGDTATGTVNAGGQNGFSAKLATSKAGLYRTTSGTVNGPGFTETGWIVLPNGNVCGSVNSTTSGGGFTSAHATSSPEGQITNFENPFPF